MSADADLSANHASGTNGGGACDARWAAVTVPSPTATLWAIWMRLSICSPCESVLPNVARSMVVSAPMSQLSSTTTLPVCGTFA